jgi:hypothetical protein
LKTAPRAARRLTKGYGDAGEGAEGDAGGSGARVTIERSGDREILE